ncbi:MAG TPA: hypothetical protein VFH27_09535 [Longimicrobiaceae bacterium]|nr:hypothetical protein [Longimicrobiaceae bacterium]
MRSSYDRFEVVTGVGAVLVSAVLWMLPAGRHVGAVLLADVFRWGGVILLVQGFFRDIHILLTRRRAGRDEARVGLWICVESTLGLLLIAQGIGLFLLEVPTLVRLPVAAWCLGLAAWWLFGYATRDLILELRRDPDHLSLLVGIR